jgi:hypothetical protein
MEKELDLFDVVQSVTRPRPFGILVFHADIERPFFRQRARKLYKMGRDCFVETDDATSALDLADADLRLGTIAATHATAAGSSACVSKTR